MAREYAKNWFSMWTDDDFCSQPVFDKLLYNVMLGQPAVILNYAGVQPINFKRWRKACRDGDQLPAERDVKLALIRMEVRRYVFTDDDTGECLIRSFMRRDEVFKQPNVMLSALRASAVVESPKLAAVLLDELTARIELPEIAAQSPRADKLRNDLQHAFKAAVDHLTATAKGICEPFPKPFAEDFPEGLPEAFTEGLPRPAEIEPFPKPFREPFSMGSVVVGVEVSQSPCVGGSFGGELAKNAPEAVKALSLTDEPPKFCPKHMPDGTHEDCGGCRGYRRHHERWEARQGERDTDARTVARAVIAACTRCDTEGWLLDDDGYPADRAERCTHQEAVNA